MNNLLPPVDLGHVSANRKSGDAAHRVLPASEFATARAEIAHGTAMRLLHLCRWSMCVAESMRQNARRLRWSLRPTATMPVPCMGL
jgi:hypothetical protein